LDLSGRKWQETGEDCTVNSFINLRPSPNSIKVANGEGKTWTDHVARMGEMRNLYKILVGKPAGKRLGSPGRRSEDNIRMDLTEVGWDGVEWMHLARERG
jgi:hypothetical protein